VNRREQEDQERDLLVLGLVVERAVDGFTIKELNRRMIDAGLATRRNVGVLAPLAIARVRTELGSDVLIYSSRLRLYRSSIDRDEAIAWLVRYLGRICTLIARATSYTEAAQRKYIEVIGADTDDRYFGDLAESLRRTQFDADRAARVIANLVGA